MIKIAKGSLWAQVVTPFDRYNEQDSTDSGKK